MFANRENKSADNYWNFTNLENISAWNLIWTYLMML